MIGSMATIPAARSGAVGRRSRLPRRLWQPLALLVLAGGAAIAPPAGGIGQPAAPASLIRASAPHADLSVLTYNVKGLPFAVAGDRSAELRAIGDRLAMLRAAGRQPGVVVLQEAFIEQARAIGDRAGYPYHVVGPCCRASGDVPGIERNWLRGETAGTLVDSGLVLLSDHPIESVERAAFTGADCAGYDCLAAKGVLLVTVAIPGKGRVAIATTHLNSNKASGAPVAEATAAYARQTRFLGQWLARHRDSAIPMILAGDMNRGRRPARIASLEHALDGLSERKPDEALASRLAASSVRGSKSDAAWIVRRGRDIQFMFDGRGSRIDPEHAEILFGTEPDGTRLSDHMGYAISYRISDAPEGGMSGRASAR